MVLWDVKCQERTDVVRIWFEVDSAIQRSMIKARPEFTQIAEEDAELLNRANEVVTAR